MSESNLLENVVETQRKLATLIGVSGYENEFFRNRNQNEILQVLRTLITQHLPKFLRFYFF